MQSRRSRLREVEDKDKDSQEYLAFLFITIYSIIRASDGTRNGDGQRVIPADSFSFSRSAHYACTAHESLNVR